MRARALLTPLLAGASLTILSSCGGGASASSSSSTTATSAATAPHYQPPERPWSELDHDARAHHMTRQVMPAMTELFAAHDGERYGDFSCATCHGADAAERHYAMPNPSLPVLYPTGTIGQMQTVDRNPVAVRFMFNQVTPAMRQLLGASELDVATGSGFTCFACHPGAAADDPLNRTP